MRVIQIPTPNGFVPTEVGAFVPDEVLDYVTGLLPSSDDSQVPPNGISLQQWEIIARLIQKDSKEMAPVFSYLACLDSPKSAAVEWVAAAWSSHADWKHYERLRKDSVSKTKRAAKRLADVLEKIPADLGVCKELQSVDLMQERIAASDIARLKAMPSANSIESDSSHSCADVFRELRMNHLGEVLQRDAAASALTVAEFVRGLSAVLDETLGKYPSPRMQAAIGRKDDVKTAWIRAFRHSIMNRGFVHVSGDGLLARLVNTARTVFDEGNLDVNINLEYVRAVLKEAGVRFDEK